MPDSTRDLNVERDYPDSRDWVYQPALNSIVYPALRPPDRLSIMNQRNEPACTGYALAAAINLLLHRSGRPSSYVSARMLYKMARRHDEWAGEDYEGSSLRGAIKGWKNMGVCEFEKWRSRYPEKQDDLTVERAKNARQYCLGAYYRLRPEIAHFHAALNDIGVIYVSAATHTGWNPENVKKSEEGLIPYEGHQIEGGHAFVILGYTDRGFIVQNSWGKEWGANGLGIWQYTDWYENLFDAWVVQLGYPTPKIFGLGPARGVVESNMALRKTLFSPTRNKIMGHFVHVDDGEFHTKGKYWSTERDVQITAEEVAAGTKYDHFLIYAHGGLNDTKDSARRIDAMKPVYLKNSIYPYHLMYDVGLGEEIKDIVLRKFNLFQRMASGVGDLEKDGENGFFDRLIEKTDQGIENTTRASGTAVWDEMKGGAEKAFLDRGAGTKTLKMFHDALSDRFAEPGDLKIHLAGHSTGAIVIARLLEMLRRKRLKLHIESIHLMAPAITVGFFEEAYGPILKGELKRLSIGKLTIFNLQKEAELNDNVVGAYRKSLLWLVSNAFEREKGRPILGMQEFEGKISKDLLDLPNLEIVYAKPDVKKSKSKSTSHGGFDNDVDTMNSILEGILGDSPGRAFTEEDLNYGKILF